MRFRPDSEEPIEDYLDELLASLRLPPRATRRLLAETEDHLRQAAEAAEQAGASRVAAERQAVEQFGPAADIAMDARRSRRSDPLALVGALVWSGVTLIGVGLVAVGLSGVLAAAFNLVGGRRFVGALPHSYSLAACRRFMTLHPSVRSCGAAAILENSHDAVALRVLAGLLGLALVGIAWATRRYLNPDPSFRRMLSAAVSGAATLAFAAAAVFLFGQSLDTAVHYGSRGVGWYLSGGIASGVGAVVSALWCWQELRLLRPWSHVVAEA